MKSSPRKHPQRIGDVLSELMARRGFARVQSGAACEAAWRTAAGEFFARQTRAGQVRRGVLEVIVSNSTIMQELVYRKADIVAELARLLPDETIGDLRFRVGPIEA